MSNQVLEVEGLIAFCFYAEWLKMVALMTALAVPYGLETSILRKSVKDIWYSCSAGVVGSTTCGYSPKDSVRLLIMIRLNLPL